MNLFGPPDVTKLKDRRDVPGLVRALGYQKDYGVRIRAAEALGELADPRAVEPLAAALKDSVSYVRQQVAASLGKIGDARALEPLGTVLRSSETDAACKAKAAEALGKIGGTRAVELLMPAVSNSDNQVRLRVITALGEIGDKRAVERLISALKDDDNAVRAAAARGLGKLGDQRAVEPLLAALPNQDSRVHDSAAEALGEIGAPAVEQLIAALTQKRWQVRAGAAQALGKIRDTRTIEPLTGVLRDQNAVVAGIAAEALAGMGAPGVDALIAALSDLDKDVAYHAAHGLGKCGDVRAVEPLSATLARTTGMPRLSVIEALDRLGWKPGCDRTGALYWIARSEWDRCAAIGAPAVEPLLALLDDNDVIVYWHAAAALEKIGGLSAEQESRVAAARQKVEMMLPIHLHSTFLRAPESWFNRRLDELLWLTTVKPNEYGRDCPYHEEGLCLARYLGQGDGTIGPERCSLQTGAYPGCFVYRIYPR